MKIIHDKSFYLKYSSYCSLNAHGYEKGNYDRKVNFVKKGFHSGHFFIFL